MPSSPVDKVYSSTGEAFEPEYNNKVDFNKSDIDGAFPESFQAISKDVPAAMVTPALGKMKSTSARTRQQTTKIRETAEARMLSFETLEEWERNYVP